MPESGIGALDVTSGARLPPMAKSMFRTFGGFLHDNRLR